MAEPILRNQSNQILNNLSVVVPCHKENPMIVATLYTELTGCGAEVIIVDDGNSMDMPNGMPYVTYPGQVGYGYAIKEGIKKATRALICTADGDGQHTVSDIQKLYAVFNMVSDCKMVIGQRWNLKETSHRWVGRKVLNFMASCINGHYHNDLNSGLRIFDRKLAVGYLPILCDTFSFTTSLTMAMVTDNHKTFCFPIDVKPRTYGKSHVKVIKDGIVTLYYIIWVGVALRTRGIRAWIRNLIGR